MFLSLLVDSLLNGCCFKGRRQVGSFETGESVFFFKRAPSQCPNYWGATTLRKHSWVSRFKSRISPWKSNKIQNGSWTSLLVGTRFSWLTKNCTQNSRETALERQNPMPCRKLLHSPWTLFWKDHIHPLNIYNYTYIAVQECTGTN